MQEIDKSLNKKKEDKSQVEQNLTNKTNIKKTRTKIFSGDQRCQFKTTTHRWNYGNGKTSSQLKIATWNINGIRRVIKEESLHQFIKKYNPDIICVQQTKINENAFNSEKIQVPGYQCYWNFCKCSSGFSGVAIFSKFKPIRMIEDFPQKNQLSQQGRIITLQFQNFYLITVYTPLSGLKLERIYYRLSKWDPTFQQHCQKIKNSGKMVIICGDMNVVHKQVDMYRKLIQQNGKKVYKNYENEPGCTQGQRNSFSQLLFKGWVDAFRKLNPIQQKYTWWNGIIHGRSRRIGRRLDYFLINTKYLKQVKSCDVFQQVQGSDHCPLIMEINVPDLPSQETTFNELVYPEFFSIMNKQSTPLSKDKRIQINSQINNQEQKRQEQKDKKQEISISVDNINNEINSKYQKISNQKESQNNKKSLKVQEFQLDLTLLQNQASKNQQQDKFQKSFIEQDFEHLQYDEDYDSCS